MSQHTCWFFWECDSVWWGCVWEQIGDCCCVLVHLCLLCSTVSLIWLKSGVSFTSVKICLMVPEPSGNGEQLKKKIISFLRCNIASVLSPWPLNQLCKKSSSASTGLFFSYSSNFRNYFKFVQNYSKSNSSSNHIRYIVMRVKNVRAFSLFPIPWNHFRVFTIQNNCSSVKTECFVNTYSKKKELSANDYKV